MGEDLTRSLSLRKLPVKLKDRIVNMKARASSQRTGEMSSCVLERSIGISDLTQLPHLNMTDFMPFDKTHSDMTSTSHSSTIGSPQRKAQSPTPSSNMEETSSTSAPPSQHSPLLSVDSASTHTTSTTSSPSLGGGDGSPWIGGTGLGSTGLGKSGRVIERLMAENDRLRREMKAEIAKREELQRGAQTQKPRFDSLQAENARLSNIKAMDDNIIKRRDRKIEELKAELDIERQKRETLERRAVDAERKRDEQIERGNKEVQQAVEQAKHASTHAEILETSHRQLAAEYRQRTATINQSLKGLLDDKEENRRKLVKLDTVNQQMRQEAEKTRRVHGELVALWDRYHEEKEAEVVAIKNDMEALKQHDGQREGEARRVEKEMQELMGQMKWIMAMKKVTDAGGVNSPPPSP